MDGCLSETRGFLTIEGFLLQIIVIKNNGIDQEILDGINGMDVVEGHGLIRL